MTKIDIAMYCIALLWGIILSVFYFGGLYQTLKFSAGRKKIKSILLTSFLLRTILLLAGFWLILEYDFYSFIISFIAFIITRFIITRKLGLGVEGR